MAVTEIHPITTTLSKALDYIQNPDKTDEKMLVSGYACSPETAVFQFNQVKKNADKKDGYLAFHLMQSFSPGEVDYETAHKIGQELADKVFRGKFQYVCATHIDKGHIHNHVIANSVSFKDYSKYNSSPNSYYYIRRISDKLCKENGLSVITEPKEHGKSHYEHTQDKQGRSWKSLLRQNIDKCILKAKNWDEFLALMQREKYEIKLGKYISFRADGQERFTRSKTLGENYTEEMIKNRIHGSAKIISVLENAAQRNLIIDIENSFKAQQSKGYAQWAKGFNLKLAAQTMNYLTEHNLLDRDVLNEKVSSLSASYDTSRSKLKSIEKRIKEIEEQIHDIDVYRKNKPVADKLETVVFKEKYRREHESELILFKAAEKAVKKHFNGEKMPLIKELRAEQKQLLSEKEKLYSETNSAKSELDELLTVQRNIDKFLGLEHEQEKAQKKKRSGELE